MPTAFVDNPLNVAVPDDGTAVFVPKSVVPAGPTNPTVIGAPKSRRAFPTESCA